jgi:hypothetical protein
MKQTDSTAIESVAASGLPEAMTLLLIRKDGRAVSTPVLNVA